MEDRVAIYNALEQLRRDLHAGVYMEWSEPLPRGRKGQDHSAQRIIKVGVGGEPSDAATLPASTTQDRRQMSINVEALKRFVTSTRYGIAWEEHGDGDIRRVTITIRSPQRYDSIGWTVMKEAMARRQKPEPLPPQPR